MDTGDLPYERAGAAPPCGGMLRARCGPTTRGVKSAYAPSQVPKD